MTMWIRAVLVVLSIGYGSGYQSRELRSSRGRQQHQQRSAFEEIPRFVTKPNTFRIPENDRVVLGCEVKNLGNRPIVWRKGTEVLAAGNMLISPDPRFVLHPNFKLELRNIRPQDAGDFVCQVTFGTNREMMEVAQTVEVLVPPRVQAKPLDGNIVVKKGTQVTLECNASGNPVPKIKWTREHDLLPQGKVTCQNEHCYTIHEVDRFDAGKYTCTADNGVGQPAKAQITLQVLFEPEIEVEAEKVHSGLGKEAHLTCIVHGEPRPFVRWYKDSTLLTSSDKVRMEERESTHRYTLVLRALASQRDFGNYSCVAENSLGTSKRHIEVHGRPTPAVFRNKAHPGAAGRNSFNLVWTVDSYTPIEEYRLLYRQIKPYHPDDGNSLSLVGGSDWTNIIIPGEGSRSEFHHEKVWLLQDLRPESQYECLVQAKNKYGWSEASRIHRFFTHSTPFSEPEARDMGWKTGTTGTGNLASSFGPLILIVALAVARLV